MSTKNRGFASMTKAKREEIARLGGKAVAAQTDMVALGKKGGEASVRARRKKE
jgi:general stress protein YciG